ncbi:MAG: hypothetical protein H6741_34835 [Alphaproteobacteria bacterium]|nr:hypothetical protein [Alphaproteobacteria bacterium]
MSILFLSLLACNLVEDADIELPESPALSLGDSEAADSGWSDSGAVEPEALGPDVDLLEPLHGAQLVAGEQALLRLVLEDPQSPPQELRYVVQSDLDGELCAGWGALSGEASCLIQLSVGEHLLEVGVWDPEEHFAADSVSVLSLDPLTLDDDLDGYSEAEGDCDDRDAARHPGAVDTPYDGVDQDCDGEDRCDVDGDGYDGELCGGPDCDDEAPGVSPGGEELPYDGVDQDCDGYDLCDVDGDGFDAEACGGRDCLDDDPSAWPGAADAWYDGVDSNCDGFSDFDADRDGYDSDAHGGDDCDDSDLSVRPGAADTWYDGVDSDCDGASDFDADQDGHDSDAHGGGDCMDTNPDVHPGTTTGFSADRGDGSFDYDCDGSEEPVYTDVVCEDGATSGWASAVPDCGEFDRYGTARFFGHTCFPSFTIQLRAQSCL